MVDIFIFHVNPETRNPYKQHPTFFNFVLFRVEPLTGFPSFAHLYPGSGKPEPGLFTVEPYHFAKWRNVRVLSFEKP